MFPFCSTEINDVFLFNRKIFGVERQAFAGVDGAAQRPSGRGVAIIGGSGGGGGRWRRDVFGRRQNDQRAQGDGQATRPIGRRPRRRRRPIAVAATGRPPLCRPGYRVFLTELFLP